MRFFIKNLKILLICLQFSFEANSEKSKCDENVSFKVFIQNEQEYKFFEDLKLKTDDYNLIIDKPIRHFNSTLYFRTNDCVKSNVLDLLKKYHIDQYAFEYTPNVQQTLRSTKRLIKQNKFSFDEISKRYLVNDEINNYALALGDHISNVYPDIDVRFNTEGYTFEGRPIASISIGYRGKSNPVAFIDAGIHAREWHSRNLALNILYKLEKEAKLGVNGLLYNISFIIIPNLNPDGYSYSYSRDRDWRKNRRPVENNCFGVDGNRNYDIEWATGEQEKDPCDDVYKGPAPFSEPETQIVRNIMIKYRHQCFLYISIHTFGNSILYPSGYYTDPHPRHQLLHRVASAGANAVIAKTGTKFKPVQSGSGLYVAAGGSDDYAIDVVGIPFAFTLESGPEHLGFIVPESQLKQTITEGWIGIKAMVKEAYYLRNRKSLKKSLAIKSADKS